MDIQIATPNQAGAIAALARRTFLDAFAAANEPQHISDYVDNAFDEARVARAFDEPGTVYFVARVDGQLGGYAKLRCRPPPPGVSAKRPVELQRLYADKALGVGGIGRALMDAVLAQATAAGHDVIWLGVWEHNLDALRFYERLAFVAVGEKEFMMGSDRQIDIVMQRPLAAAAVGATTGR